MGIFSGVFKTLDSSVTPKTFRVRGDEAVDRVRPALQGNYDVPNNPAYSAANNGLTQWMRDVGNITDSPVGARTHGDIFNNFGSLHKNLNEARQITSKNVTQLKDEQAALLGGREDPNFGLYSKQIGQANRQQAGIAMRQAGAVAQQAGAHAWRTAKYSLGEGSLGERALKTGVIGGAWMGANTVGRGLTGGGLTYNNDGRRDIAGIPFL